MSLPNSRWGSFVPTNPSFSASNPDIVLAPLHALSIPESGSLRLPGVDTWRRAPRREHSNDMDDHCSEEYERRVDMFSPVDSIESACIPLSLQLRGGFGQPGQSSYGPSSGQASPDFGKRCQPGPELGRGPPGHDDSRPRRPATSSARAGQRSHRQDNLASWGADGGRGKEDWSSGRLHGSYAHSDATSLQRQCLGQTRDSLIRDGGGPSSGRVRRLL